MDCREVREHISFAVDNRLEARVRADFDTHITACHQCRNEFELEHLTKQFVRRTISRSQPPPGLATRIISSLESSEVEPPKRWWLGWLDRAPRIRPAFAVGALVVLALLLFVSLPLNIQHAHTSPIDNNIIHQTFNNYDALLAGVLQPEIASGDYGDLRTYFKDRVGYAVSLPKIDKCRQIGGLVSQYEGKDLAHVVYKFDNQVVYLYQVDAATAFEGTTLSIPTTAKDELLKTGWYVETPHSNCSFVMWVVENTLCAAIADMDKNRLIAYLSYLDE